MQSNLRLKSWRSAIVMDDASILQAINNLNDNALKITLVTDKNDCLVGTLTDGDIRRGLLAGLSLADGISTIINKNPVVAFSGDTDERIIKIMLERKVDQVPLLDQNKKILDLKLLSHLVSTGRSEVKNLMVIMAGGIGSRLRPFTNNCPKPMVLVKGRPMLEIIIERARNCGFRKFVIAINYMGETIREYFGDGTSLNVDIEYLHEDSPLGTAGALGLMQKIPESPVVVTNGDVIADLDYRSLLNFHINSGANATMALQKYEWQNPFGVIETKKGEIISLTEKPITAVNVNAGIYVLGPQAFQEIKKDEYCDMPDLFRILISKQMKVVGYPMYEAWIDIGNPQDLDRVNNSNEFNI